MSISEDAKRYFKLKEKFENSMKQWYQKENLEDLYEDNKNDLEIWKNHYIKNFGEIGIKESTECFLNAIASGKIIKLHSLQFEELEKDSYLALKELPEEDLEDSVILGVHIREGEDLSEKALEKSYKKAFEFFLKRYPDKNKVLFTCYSWVLDPRLKDFLSKDSNILNFQKDYEIIDEKKSDDLAWRVFGESLEIPENRILNSLERFTKKYFEEKKLKMFLGYFIR